MAWHAILGALIGGVIGFLVSRLFRRDTGTVPLMRNPAVMTLVCAILGALIVDRTPASVPPEDSSATPIGIIDPSKTMTGHSIEV